MSSLPYDLIVILDNAKAAFANACYAVKSYWESKNSHEYTEYGERRVAIQRETEAWEAQRDYWRAKAKELNNGS